MDGRASRPSGADEEDVRRADVITSWLRASARASARPASWRLTRHSFVLLLGGRGEELGEGEKGLLFYVYYYYFLLRSLVECHFNVLVCCLLWSHSVNGCSTSGGVVVSITWPWNG